ncbi:MAG: hypothetical protein ACRCSG_09610 [Cellulosilyticaceae bacterium]
MMNISQIVIKGTLGYCCVDEAYSDKVTVTGQSVACEYHPSFEIYKKYRRGLKSFNAK